MWVVRPVLPLQAAALAIALGLAIYIWYHRELPGTTWIAVLMFAVAGWTLFSILESSSQDLGLRVTFLNIQYLGVVVVPVAWLAFAATYTGRGKWLTPPILALFFIIPALTVLFIWWNPDGLFRAPVVLDPRGELVTEMGPAFWLHATYSYLLMGVATAYLVIFIRRAPRIYRGQGVVLLFATLFPLAGNVLFVAGLSPLGDIDPTPLAFTVMGVLVCLDIFIFRLFDVFPLALSTAVDTMSDAVLVLDRHTHLIHLNPAAERILQIDALYERGQLLDEVWPGGSTTLASHLQQEESRGELILEQETQPRYYELQASPVTSRRNRLEGWVIALRDVTERKEAGEALRAQKEIFEQLVEVAHATSENLTMAETLRNVLEITVSLTAAEVGNLILIDERGRLDYDLLSLAEAKFVRDAWGAGQALQEGLAGWVVRHRELILIADAQEDERWVAIPGTATFVARAVLAVPILFGEQVLGVLTLTHGAPGHFTEDHVTLIGLAVDQIATAVRNARLFDEQRKLTNRQAILYEVLQQVGSQLDREAVAQVAVDAIVRLADWPVVGVLLPDEDRRYLLLRAVAGSRATTEVGATIHVTEGICGRAYRRGELQYAPDVKVDPDYISVSDYTRSEVAVPLLQGGEALGILNLESDKEAAFTEEDLQLARSLSEAIALALDNAAYHTEMRRFAATITQERSRLAAIIHASRDGILLLGADHRLLVVNQAAGELLNLEGRAGGWEGRALEQLIVALELQAPEVAEAARRELDLGGGEVFPASEGEWVLPSRILHWLHLPVKGVEMLVGRLLILRDVTQERLLAQMREDLTHTLVHDLRSPLSTLSTSIQFLQSEFSAVGQEDFEQILEISDQAARRMLHLIDSILDIASLEEDQLPLHPTEIRLPVLIEDVIYVHLPQVRQKRLTLTQDLPPGLPLAYADPELIKRVVQNLLHNAIKFTPAEGHIHLAACCRNHCELLVSIRDSGPGIVPELRGRLFEKFAVGPIQGRGTGLGLAFCRMAIEAHGGQIWVETANVQGTQFSFTLPLGPENVS